MWTTVFPQCALQRHQYCLYRLCSVEYVFSRLLQGMEAALTELARRASRTVDAANETRAEFDALPDVVKKSLTAGLPLDMGLETYVDEAWMSAVPG